MRGSGPAVLEALLRVAPGFLEQGALGPGLSPTGPGHTIVRKERLGFGGNFLGC